MYKLCQLEIRLPNSSTYCMLPKGHEKLNLECSIVKLKGTELEGVLFQLDRLQEKKNPPQQRTLCGITVEVDTRAPKDRLIVHPEVLAQIESKCPLVTLTKDLQ